MIQVQKQKNDNATIIQMAGSLEETVNLLELIGPPTETMIINTKRISRINSTGVKAWIAYFQSCQVNGTKLTFIECSMPVIEQMNLISNFNCGGKVESIYVPFVCKTCKATLMALFQTEVLQRLKFQIPQTECTKCKGIAIFDDQIDEYFACFKRV